MAPPLVGDVLPDDLPYIMAEEARKITPWPSGPISSLSPARKGAFVCLCFSPSLSAPVRASPP
eukprot:scaffold645_cov247-Pinguiococcus_pyrenoidosus.AAC.26